VSLVTPTATEYGITGLSVAVNPEGAIQWIQLLLGSGGQEILKGSGLTPLDPPLGRGNVPFSLMPPVVKG
jgi:ABC-type molybdate transport system substrate-binding protein